MTWWRRVARPAPSWVGLVALQLLLSAVLASCAVGGSTASEPALAPVEVSVVLRRALGLAPQPSWRYAVVWTAAPGDAWVSHDASLSPWPVHDTLRVPLAVPSAAWQEALAPVESLAFLYSERAVAIYRPRLVVYDDTNGNARFDFVESAATGNDALLAVDGQGALTWGLVLRLDDFLATITMAEAEIFYEVTGGRYTPFVPVLPGLPLAMGDQQDAARGLELNLSSSMVAREQFMCKRKEVVIYDSSVAATLPAVTHVDQTLDPRTVCGAALADCRREDFKNISTAKMETLLQPGENRLLQCRSMGLLEAVLVQQGERDCDGCACRWLFGYELYVADKNALPPWWPCGRTLAYCESMLPPYMIEPRCAAAESAAGQAPP